MYIRSIILESRISSKRKDQTVYFLCIICKMVSMAGFLKSVSVLGLVAFVVVAAASPNNSTSGSGRVPSSQAPLQPKLQQRPALANRGGSIGNNNSSRVVLPAGRTSPSGSPTSSHPAALSPAAKRANSNATRVVRSTDEEESEDSSPQVSHGSKSSNSSGFVPSTHPLFANRHSSNITNSLRPKLRGPSGSPNTKQTAGSSEEEEDTHKESPKDEEESHVSSSVRKSVSSDSSESTVVSTGHVGIQSRNSTRPKSGPSRARTSTTSAPSEDEEVSFF